MDMQIKHIRESIPVSFTIFTTEKKQSLDLASSERLNFIKDLFAH